MKKVYKVEPGMDKSDILCTTYQMRNFYRQFGDGFFSVLDVMNYIQHQQIVRWCKKGQHVLDICCGRGLLLPMLRYERKDIASYTGVDIEPKNARFLTERVTDGKSIEDDYYPFPVRYVESNVAEMAEKLSPNRYDVIVYTSAIEHMQLSAGQQSLKECRKVAAYGGTLILTCPNTPENQDGFDTQYAAHVYEWKRRELIAGLKDAEFGIVSEWGLLLDGKDLKEEMERIGAGEILENIRKYVPAEWYVPVLSTMFPGRAKEIGFLARAI